MSSSSSRARPASGGERPPRWRRVAFKAFLAKDLRMVAGMLPVPFGGLVVSAILALVTWRSGQAFAAADVVLALLLLHLALVFLAPLVFSYKLIASESTSGTAVLLAFADPDGWRIVLSKAAAALVGALTVLVAAAVIVLSTTAVMVAGGYSSEIAPDRPLQEVRLNLVWYVAAAVGALGFLVALGGVAAAVTLAVGRPSPMIALLAGGIVVWLGTRVMGIVAGVFASVPAIAYRVGAEAYEYGGGAASAEVTPAYLLSLLVTSAGLLLVTSRILSREVEV